MSFLTSFLFYIASLVSDFPLYFTSKEALPTNGSLNFTHSITPNGKLLALSWALGGRRLSEPLFSSAEDSPGVGYITGGKTRGVYSKIE